MKVTYKHNISVSIFREGELVNRSAKMALRSAVGLYGGASPTAFMHISWETSVTWRRSATTAPDRSYDVGWRRWPCLGGWHLAVVSRLEGNSEVVGVGRQTDCDRRHQGRASKRRSSSGTQRALSFSPRCRSTTASVSVSSSSASTCPSPLLVRWILPLRCYSHSFCKAHDSSTKTESDLGYVWRRQSLYKVDSTAELYRSIRYISGTGVRLIRIPLF